MTKIVAILSLIFSIAFTQVAYSQYRSRPIGMSKKRYKHIKSSHYRKREVAVVPRQFRDSFWDKIGPRSHKVKYVNANAINKKKNKQMIARKRKEDNNYRDYREQSEFARASNGGNFSIYDK